MKYLKKAYLIPSIWAIIILILSLLPGKDMPSFLLWELINSDKIAHFGFYGVQAYLLIRSMELSSSVKSLRKWIFLTLFLVMAYGGLIEIVQGTLCPDRYADKLDFLANSIGAGLGLLMYRFKPKIADFCFKGL